MNYKELRILVGLKIKENRLNKNYTQEKLCEILNIDITGYSKIENGKSFPSFENLCNIMRVLEINPNEFFDFLKITKSSEINKEISKIKLMEDLNKLDSETMAIVQSLIKKLI